MGLLASVRANVQEVNRRYRKPEIETTLFTRICLVSLRVYLTTMVLLMVYALVHTAVTGGEAVGTQAQPPAATQGTTAPPNP